MFKDIIIFIEENLGMSADLQFNIFKTIVAIIVVYFLHFIAMRLVRRKTKDQKSIFMWGKTISYLRVILLLLIFGKIWLTNFEYLTTYFGLLSAGIAIALKDIISNFAGWVFILWRRPFEIGDRIEIDGQRGDVIDIRIFQFTMIEIGNWVDADQSTGRMIHIPNGYVYTKPMANYTKGFDFIWNEIAVLITFESKWEKAKKIIEDIGKEHALGDEEIAKRKIKKASKKFMINYKNLTPIVYTSVKESGVVLTLRYLCNPRIRRGSENEIWENILKQFAKNKDIDLAYPTTRFYNINEDKK
ncbi:MAG: mechanosensitive ion channel [Candidatus Delongbacteria bacterium]|nr:mechanosensitive ion channel [Candidatus Delongbacteria bacterium]